MTALLPSLRDRISQSRTSQAQREPDSAAPQPGPDGPASPATDPKKAARRKILRERFLTWLPLVLSWSASPSSCTRSWRPSTTTTSSSAWPRCTPPP
ncbi:MAG: hypothetical protein ACFNS9_10385 [Actinomyces sp.]